MGGSVPTRWDRLSPELRLQRFQTADYLQARLEAWGRIKEVVVRRRGKPSVRSGRTKFTAKDIIQMADSDPELKAALGVGHAKDTRPERHHPRNMAQKFVARAPIDGLILHSKDRNGFSSFWIERLK